MINVTRRKFLQTTATTVAALPGTVLANAYATSEIDIHLATGVWLEKYKDVINLDMQARWHSGSSYAPNPRYVEAIKILGNILNAAMEIRQEEQELTIGMLSHILTTEKVKINIKVLPKDTLKCFEQLVLPILDGSSGTMTFDERTVRLGEVKTEFGEKVKEAMA